MSARGPGRGAGSKATLGRGGRHEQEPPTPTTPNRRASTTFEFDCGGLSYVATFSRFPDGTLAEVFISNHKVNSQADTNAKVAALDCSLTVSGVPVDVIRCALLRDSRGNASGPFGHALDLIAAGFQR